MRALVIGAHGQLGQVMVRLLVDRGDEVIAAGREMIDLSRPAEAARIAETSGADVIINAAAYTAVDAAESDQALAETVNAEAPARLAEVAHRIGALLIHYSTDYVFDGTKEALYVETDPTNPLSVYGRTKRQGEEAILATGASVLIFRTSWLYARRGKNFLTTMVRLAEEGRPLTIVDDQWGAPTWVDAVAEGSFAVIDRLTADGDPLADAARSLRGIYHMTCGGETTWRRFAEAIFTQQGLAVDVTPVPTSSYPTPATRPLRSVLSNEKLAATFGVRLPEWEEGLARCLASLKV